MRTITPQRSRAPRGRLRRGLALRVGHENWKRGPPDRAAPPIQAVFSAQHHAPGAGRLAAARRGPRSLDDQNNGAQLRKIPRRSVRRKRPTRRPRQSPGGRRPVPRRCPRVDCRRDHHRHEQLRDFARAARSGRQPVDPLRQGLITARRCGLMVFLTWPGLGARRIRRRLLLRRRSRLARRRARPRRRLAARQLHARAPRLVRAPDAQRGEHRLPAAKGYETHQ